MHISQMQEFYYGHSGDTFDFFRDLDITLRIHLGIELLKIPVRGKSGKRKEWKTTGRKLTTLQTQAQWSVKDSERNSEHTQTSGVIKSEPFQTSVTATGVDEAEHRSAPKEAVKTKQRPHLHR